MPYYWQTDAGLPQLTERELAWAVAAGLKNDRIGTLLARVADARGVEREAFLRVLGEVWIGGPIGIHRAKLEPLLPDGRCDLMMTAKERAALDALPAMVTAYRGAEAGLNEVSFSWTPDRVWATRVPFEAWFSAHRPRLVTAEIDKTAIVAVKINEHGGRRPLEIITKRPRVLSVEPLEPPPDAQPFVVAGQILGRPILHQLPSDRRAAEQRTAETAATLGPDMASAAAVRALVTVSDEEIIPPASLFWNATAVHGPAHVARVMVHAFRLIAATGLSDEGPRLWAAVYLHDLARLNDEADPNHGEAAWRRLADRPDVRALFTRGGVRDEDYPAIRSAVVAHCTDDELVHVPIPHLQLARLLKDVDALDRVRLGEFDRRYLHYHEALEASEFAKALYSATKGIAPEDVTFRRVWDAAMEIRGVAAPTN